MLRIVLSLAVLALVIITSMRMLKSQLGSDVLRPGGASAMSPGTQRVTPQQELADQMRQAMDAAAGARASDAEK